MTRLLAVPAGRRAKWVVLGVWFALLFGAMAANLPGKFSEAEKNESSSFLPGEAESTKALEIVEDLQDGERAPAVVVYRRDGGLTPQDTRRIEADLRELNALDFRNTTDFGNPAGPRAEQPFQLSPDGTTALIANTIEGDGESATLIDPIDRYRELVSTDGDDDGLQVKVTGPAGITADSIKVFENINGTLIAAAASLVLLLLIVIYRSPFFWFFPLFSVMVAELVSRSLGYGVSELGTTINGQSSAIMSILVLGAGTDYALLLVARYREELRTHEDKHEAMALALRSAGPAIIASALTVAVALFFLVFAKVNGTAGLGPLGALGILTALAVQLTFLPALLLAVGRRPFWPRIPRYAPDAAPVTDATHGAWRRLGDRIARRPRRVWVGTLIVLGAFSLGLLNFDTGLTQGNAFRDDVEAVAGQELVEQAFPAGQSAPTDVVVRDPASVEAVRAAVARVDGVAAVEPTSFRGEDGTLLAAFLDRDPYSTEAFDRVPDIRAAAQRAAPGTLVGGPTAIEYDLREAGTDDTVLLIPITIAVVFLILLVLLRAVTLSLLLIGTVVLSFAAALGASVVVFDVFFGFPGVDTSFPLFAFIFLVALGVDYNIFLMARVREETEKHGTAEGMLRGLAVTGGVITSAGIVLAGTFSVLAVLPLVALTQLGVTIAFGVLLDTLIVRSIIVPALVLDLGPRVWWPSRLAQAGNGARGGPPDEPGAAGSATPPPAGQSTGR